MNAEPVTAIAIAADRIPQVSLTLVIEGDYVGIRGEWMLVLVLYLDGRTRKDKAIVPCWTGIAEAPVIRRTAKCTNPDEASFEENPIGIRLFPAPSRLRCMVLEIQ